MATIDVTEGYIAAFQLQVGTQRAEIVIPMCLFSGSPGSSQVCSDLAQALVTNSMPELLAAISPQASVIGCSVHGMLGGKIPARIAFAVGDEPGVLGVNASPQQVAGLVSFYPDMADFSVDTRLREGRNFIPGIADEKVSDGIIANDVIAALNTWAQTLIDGLPGTGSALYKRVLRVLIDLDHGPLHIILEKQVKSVVGTIRKRLQPR